MGCGAGLSERSPAVLPPDEREEQQRRNARWIGWGSARVALDQMSGVSASPMPVATPMIVEPVRRRTSTTVAPAAVATAMSESALMRKAGSPIGVSSRLARNPRSTYVGYPVGWAVPMIGSTVWNSPVSQNPTPGMRPDQALTITRAATARGGPATARRRAFTIRGCCPR